MNGDGCAVACQEPHSDLVLQLLIFSLSLSIPLVLIPSSDWTSSELSVALLSSGFCTDNDECVCVCICVHPGVCMASAYASSSEMVSHCPLK